LIPITPTPGLPFPAASAPDNLRLVYVYQGNLYLQDGSQPPLQLTFSGQDHHPIFSDDGEKIVFWRGRVPDLQDMYAINADGSKERALLTSEIILALDQEGYDETTEGISRAFVPGTHQLLCSTHQFDHEYIKFSGGQRNSDQRNLDILLVDGNTGEIEVLFPPGEGGGYRASPDGRLIAITRSGRVDVADLSVQIIYPNLVTYTPSQPFEAYPNLYWLPDSKGLIVSLPAEMDYYDPMEAPAFYVVWRYALDGTSPVYVPLDPSPIGYEHRVSPDGNWIIYLPNPIELSNSQMPIYLGNLQDGDTQLYVSLDPASPGIPSWSTDSQHFIYSWGVPRSFYLGSVNELPVLLAEGSFFGWVDASRYLYLTDGTLMIGEIDGEAKSILTEISRFMFDDGNFEFVLLDARSR